MKTKKIILPESQMPTQWYNIVSDMKNRPLPPLNPATKEPVTLEQMSALFAEELMKQEMSTERYIDIPEEVQDLYKIYRSTPLVRAYGLEKALDTPAKIYFKNESVSPVGSHKTNTAIPQDRTPCILELIPQPRSTLADRIAVSNSIQGIVQSTILGVALRNTPITYNATASGTRDWSICAVISRSNYFTSYALT